MSHNEVLSVAVVMLVDEPVVVRESLEAYGELFDVFINFVELGRIVGELEVVGTDGGGGRSEGGKGEGSHL